jgi:hypothetical protein
MAGPDGFASPVPGQRPGQRPGPGPGRAREQVLAETVIGLVDTLGDDFDLVGLLDRLTGACVALLQVSGAAVVLDDGWDGSAVGSCTGQGAEARSGSVVSFPLRRWGQTLGALDLFAAGPGPLSWDDRCLAQVLADAATIGILHHRSVHAGSILAEQLQHALNVRVVIEQAKGILAERHGLSPDVAFEALRRWARAHNLTVDDVARSVLSGDHAATVLTTGTVVVRPVPHPLSRPRPRTSGRDPGRRRCGCQAPR